MAVTDIQRGKGPNNNFMYVHDIDAGKLFRLAFQPVFQAVITPVTDTVAATSGTAPFTGSRAALGSDAMLKT